jgi:hypothetical protein
MWFTATNALPTEQTRDITHTVQNPCSLWMEGGSTCPTGLSDGQAPKGDEMNLSQQLIDCKAERDRAREEAALWRNKYRAAHTIIADVADALHCPYGARGAQSVVLADRSFDKSLTRRAA